MTDRKIVILATGGTIAGLAGNAAGQPGYKAAQVHIDALVAAVPSLQGRSLVCEQVAQIDSKDMSFEIWRTLVLRCSHWLAQGDVAGVVITHGTDTLEETAFFLQSVLGPAKPVVLTCAMRPANALYPDGPQNLMDAVTVAGTEGAMGVVAVCAGTIHSAADVTKQHSARLDAFTSGEAGPIGVVRDGAVQVFRPWPEPSGREPRAVVQLPSAQDWPRVEIVISHAQASGALIDALVAQGVRGLVVAGTGNGTVHCAMDAALGRADAAGVSVLRASRCAQGGVSARADDAFPGAQSLSPVKARIALMLRLMLG